MNIKKLYTALALIAVMMTAISTGASAKTDDIRVMSFNIRVQLKPDTGDLTWENRKAGCLKAIKKHKPDLIGFQEANFGPKEYLLKGLPKYQIVDRSEKPGTPDPNLASNQNPIFFRADKFELLDYGSFWLNEDQTPRKKGWDAQNVRHANWVKLRVRKSGQIIYFFNTHFDHIGKVARYQSSVLMRDMIKKIAGDKSVVFLTADFNMPCGNQNLKPLQDYLEVTELAVKKADKAPTFNGFGKEGGDGLWLDHIFFRNAKAENFEVVNEKFGIRYISDHYPVVSDFKIKIPKR